MDQYERLLTLVRQAPLASETRQKLLGDVRDIVLSLRHRERDDRARLRKLSMTMPRHHRNGFLVELDSVFGKTNVQRVDDRGSAGRATEPEYSETPNSSRHDIAVVCALEEELAPYRRFGLSRPPPTSIVNAGWPTTELLTGEVPRGGRGPLRIVAASAPKMGMVDAALVSAQLLASFQPHFLCMTGVCGGNPDESSLEAGDLIVATEVVTFQTGKLANDGFRPEPRTESLPFQFVAKLKAHAQQCADRAVKEWVGPKPTRSIRVHFGLLACSDLVVDKSGAFGELVLSINRKALGVEMESYSVFRAAALSSTSVTPLVAKCVMDFTSDKSDLYKPFGAFVSSRFLMELAAIGTFDLAS